MRNFLRQFTHFGGHHCLINAGLYLLWSQPLIQGTKGNVFTHRHSKNLIIWFLKHKLHMRTGKVTCLFLAASTGDRSASNH